jgi:hypothetical protein
MYTFRSRLVLPLALVATLGLATMTFAQDHGVAYNSGFGWHTGDCGCGAGGGAFSHARAKYDAFRADWDLVTARNDAWPLPFSCWDREAYYAIINQQYAQGLQVAHTLTSDYFDPNTHELNRAGEQRVAWIMQNAPVNDRQIFVYEDMTGPALDKRLASVRNVVDRWYGHLGDVSIAASQVHPTPIPATYQQRIMEQHTNALPTPNIPISSGQTITSSVN